MGTDVKLVPVSGVGPHPGMRVTDGIIAPRAPGMTAEHRSALIEHMAETCESSASVTIAIARNTACGSRRISGGGIRTRLQESLSC
ncbi:hypothetical protein [Amycolatopsis sp. NPDC004378]